MDVHRPHRRRMALLIFACASLCATAPTGAGRIYHGVVYGQSDPERLLYRWELKQCPERWLSIYARPDGSVSVVDESWFEHGQFLRYSYYRPSTGERSSVKYENNTANFEHQEFGIQRSRHRSIDGIFLTGHTLPQFIQEHLGDFKSGKRYDIRYGVLGKTDDYAFRLDARPPERSGEVTIQMTATSAFVRMAVDPVLFVFTEDGRFLRLSGRLLPMELENGKLAPVDGTLTVTGDAPLDCPLKEPALNPPS